MSDQNDFSGDSRQNSPQKQKHSPNSSSSLLSSRLQLLLPQEKQQRPIVVGYAFGPKKMSTMGVVMAEASKAKLSANLLMPPPASLAGGTKSQKSITSSLTEARLNDFYRAEEAAPSAGLLTRSKPESAYYRVSSTPSYTQRSDGVGGSEQPSSVKTNVVFTLGNSNDDGDDGTTCLSNIVRHFRSSCSSVCTTASTSTVTTSTGTPLAMQQQYQPNNGTEDQRAIPIRVSFVPLDPGTIFQYSRYSHPLFAELTIFLFF
jgi:hypothetical protein